MKIKSILKKFFSPKGFTLIELLIVIAILGILAAGILVAIDPLTKINQAKDSALKSNMAQIVNALQASFTSNNGVYPASLQVLATSRELKNVPKQPNGSDYQYVVSTICEPRSCDVAVWGSYSDTRVGVFHCWDSPNNAYKVSPRVPVHWSPVCP